MKAYASIESRPCNLVKVCVVQFMVLLPHILFHVLWLGKDAQRQAVQTVQRYLPPMHEIAHGWKQVVKVSRPVTHEFLHDLSHGFSRVLLHLLLSIVFDKIVSTFPNDLGNIQLGIQPGESSHIGAFLKSRYQLYEVSDDLAARTEALPQAFVEVQEKARSLVIMVRTAALDRMPVYRPLAITIYTLQERQPFLWSHLSPQLLYISRFECFSLLRFFRFACHQHLQAPDSL